MDENLRCMSYSVENKCCSFFYQSGCIIPIQDLDKKCNGVKMKFIDKTGDLYKDSLRYIKEFVLFLIIVYCCLIGLNGILVFFFGVWIK